MAQSYYDVYGRCHIIKKELSSGGQGIVYRTQEPDMLLKLEWDSDRKGIRKDASANKKFEDIRLLPIPGQLHVTLPQSVLRDATGYTMRLLDEMVSFEEAFSGDGKEIIGNAWLEQFRESDSDLLGIFGAFIATGGKRKRLDAFLKSACILSELHANGLVYCDVSDRNMFVSEEKGLSNVWLIDSDNLDFMKNTIKSGGLHTPGFGAPEVLGGKGNTFYSDVFSFAVSLFWNMTGNHPYVGPALDEYLTDDFLVVMEEEYACGCGVPWIADRECDSNASESRIPYSMIFSGEILEYFQRTFGMQGRTKRTLRTTMPEWAYVIAKELDKTIHCHNCEMDYDRDHSGDSNYQCPWCDAHTPVLCVKSYRMEKEEKTDVIWEYVHEKTEGEISVPARVLDGFCSGRLDKRAFSVRLTDGKIIIDCLCEGYDFKLWMDGGKYQDIYGKTEIEWDGSIKLIAEKERMHDIILIEIEG